MPNLTLTGVYGNWITQRALQSPASRRSAQWVGIGDFDIIQTGTDSNYNCGLFCSNSVVGHTVHDLHPDFE